MVAEDLTEFEVHAPDPQYDEPLGQSSGGTQAVLAGGCFWCTEAVFRKVPGVLGVVSGYAGGNADQASYDAVCGGGTGHAEAIRLAYDPSRTTYGKLLKVFFFVAHDPTQLDCQGPDVGSQYRSMIFYLDSRQKKIAERYIRQIDSAKFFKRPIATRLERLKAFFEAEAYHQNYVAQNPRQAYVVAVANPKLEKLRHFFGDNKQGTA